ncbi:hypothetical protein [Pseudomonas sp. MBLB4136]|uniref:hypothetical protein n=1 Tax=Pseudomonas sp. MBLB4136 TaxID=3451558 RepID=UPI003F74F888
MNMLSRHLAAAAALLAAAPALASHCDADFANARAAIDRTYYLEPNVEAAVVALLPAAVEACRQEAARFANAELGSPILDPDYVSVGQSMLINVTELISGQ